MSDLLALAVSAHGGLERWNSVRTLEARMSVGGGIFAAKQNPGLQNNVTYKVFTREERLTIDHFSAPDRRISFVPSRLTLETMGGEVIEVRDDPRSAFAGQTNESPWDTLHVAYFTSYALWTYLNLPFLGLRQPSLTPSPAIRMNNITYFGPDGLMRRHDYTVEVLGGATGANYSTDYKEF